jgi:hypothetical protein
MLHAALSALLILQYPDKLAPYMSPLPEGLEAPLPHSNPQYGPQVLRIGMAMPLAPNLGVLLEPGKGFVTWRQNVNEVSRHMLMPSMT